MRSKQRALNSNNRAPCWRMKSRKRFLRVALSAPVIRRERNCDEILAAMVCHRRLARSRFAFLITIPLLAAEGAEPDPAESTTGLIFRWLNFVFVFGGLRAYLIAKHGKGFFGANAKAISARNITEAQAMSRLPRIVN